MSSQPIALPNGADNVPASSAFNPASYTRAFFGSPISWRAGSFGSRFYPGTSPGQLLAPLDASELRTKLSSSIDSDPGSLLNALNALEREDELCRNYTCCGLHLNDLHALVEHFEECHVVVLDPNAPPPSHNPAPAYPTPPPSNQAYAQQNPPSYYPPPPHAPPHTSDDMELDMELDLDSSPASSSASSPPQTPLAPFPLPLNTPYPHNSHFAPPYSGHAATAPSSPISAFDTTAVMPAQQYPHQAFNAYAGYADFSRGMPGTDSSVGVPPALLFGSHHPGPAQAPSNAPARPPQTPSSTPSSSRVSSPLPASTPRASTTLSRPASSLLLSKPFRCPKPNCSKSYKQANGLKYHMTHGSCNFAPPKDLEALQALLAERGGNAADLREGELREVEREAERRLRPFACGVADCQRRYKNMNGLRYHYQHSGDHGAIGLRLLASGQHECLQGAKRGARTAPATPVVPSPAPPAQAQWTYFEPQAQQQRAQAQAQAQQAASTQYYVPQAAAQ